MEIGSKFVSGGYVFEVVGRCEEPSPDLGCMAWGDWWIRMVKAT